MTTRALCYSEHPVAPSSAHGKHKRARDIRYSRLQRMDKSLRYQWPALLITFAFLVISLFTAESAEGAPLITTDTLPAPPTEVGMLNDAFDRITHPEPTGRHISFFKNHQCTLHPGNERDPGRTKTKSVICGLRELDLPEDAGSGVRFWTPRKCQRYHCQCLATRDVNRQRRTISDNKTDIVYRRYRVFECV